MEENVTHRNKLEEIADRSAADYQTSKDTGVPLDQTQRDRQDLWVVVSAAYAMVDEFRTFARNIRHNNYDHRPDWEERAKTYERSAAELVGKLEDAVAKL